MSLKGGVLGTTSLASNSSPFSAILTFLQKREKKENLF